MSAPAANAFSPDPVITSNLLDSGKVPLKTWSNSLKTSALSAFRACGLLMVIWL
jgi:hypothetical protein